MPSLLLFSCSALAISFLALNLALISILIASNTASTTMKPPVLPTPALQCNRTGLFEPMRCFATPVFSSISVVQTAPFLRLFVFFQITLLFLTSHEQLHQLVSSSPRLLWDHRGHSYLAIRDTGSGQSSWVLPLDIRCVSTQRFASQSRSAWCDTGHAAETVSRHQRNKPCVLMKKPELVMTYWSGPYVVVPREGPGPSVETSFSRSGPNSVSVQYEPHLTMVPSTSRVSITMTWTFCSQHNLISLLEDSWKNALKLTSKNR
jgi:hypothetical protein